MNNIQHKLSIWMNIQYIIWKCGIFELIALKIILIVDLLINECSICISDK